MQQAVNGKMALTALPPSKVHLLITGKNVLMNREFEGALAPPGVAGRAALQRTFQALTMTGKINFSAEVIDRPSQPKDLEVQVKARVSRMRPKFFEYDLSDVSASVYYAHDQVELRNIQARHDNTQLAIASGQVLVTGENTYQVRLLPPVEAERRKPSGSDRTACAVPLQLGDGQHPSSGLRVQGLLADQDLLTALPPVLRRGLAGLHLQGPVDLNTALIIDQKEANKGPVIWWDGKLLLAKNGICAGVDLTDLSGVACCCGRFDGQQIEGLVGDFIFERATILGQPITQLRSHIEVAPDAPQALRLPNLSARLFGGQLGAQARVECGNKLTYDLLLEGMQIRLEEFGQHNLGPSADMQGAARVSLHLYGTGTEMADLKGHGQAEVRDAKLYRLPILLDLLKFLNLNVPDRTAFESADLAVSIDNGKVQVQKMDLHGRAISLRCRHGTVNLDGSKLSLDFHTDWTRSAALLPPWLNFPQAIGDQLLKIKVRGKLGDVRFEKELVPIIQDPLLDMFGVKH